MNNMYARIRIDVTRSATREVLVMLADAFERLSEVERKNAPSIVSR